MHTHISRRVFLLDVVPSVQCLLGLSLLLDGEGKVGRRGRGNCGDGDGERWGGSVQSTRQVFRASSSLIASEASVHQLSVEDTC